MDYLKDFIIHFVGLSVGNHHFEFDVNDLFFERFEYSQLHQGNVKVLVELDKQERMLVFSFHLEGTIEVTCDRCAEEFSMPVSGNEHLIVKYGGEYAEESDDMITIPATEYKVDLSPYIYEYLHLMLPVRIVHPEDENGHSDCNQETLRILNELTAHTDTDPRWDVLNRLKSSVEDGSQEEKKQKKKK